MKVCAVFVLFGILANSHSFVYPLNINPKSVNLELKTVLEFNDKDKQSDIKFLDEIQNVITEIRTIIDKNSINKNFRRNSRDETLTDFIQKAVNIINTYEDSAFDDFFNILHNEIGNYHYRDCKFYELTENHEFEKVITAKLDSIKDRPTYVKKTKINGFSDVLKYENYDSNVEKIVHYINSLYTQAGHKFRRLLSSLERYGKSKSRRSYSHLVKIIKNGLRSIIFDHYTNLSMNTRQQLKHKIKAFWKRYEKNHPSKISNVAKVTSYNTKKSKNEAKNLEPDPEKYKINTNDKTTKLNRIKTKQSKHNNKITKKDDLNNEMKRHKNTREETIVESVENQEKETSQTTRNTDFVFEQWSVQKGDKDSLSAPFSSIEFLIDQQNNTQQFLARVLDKNTQKSTNLTNKLDIVDTLNVWPKTHTNNTTQKKVLWIEQSTGKLPKAVLDRLANKASRSNPNLTGGLNKNGHKHKKNKNKKTWHRKVNKPNNTRRKGNEPDTAKTHKKLIYPRNHKALKYSEQKREKTNGKKYHQENDKYELAGDKTHGNLNEPENGETSGSIYESEIEKLQGKIYELENDIGEEKIYDSRHESEVPTKHRFEFNYKNELKEDRYKYKKKLKPNKPTNIKRYETEHGQPQGKVVEPIYDETGGNMYESNEDKINGNIFYNIDNTKSAKKQFMHDSKEDKKHKSYNTSKLREPTLVKHNHRYVFNQYDVKTTNSLLNKKDEKVNQHKKTKGLLRVDLKHDKRPVIYTGGFPRVLDGQMLSEPGKTIKHLAKGTTATMKVPNSSRLPRLQLNDIKRMKAPHQSSPLSTSSIGRLYVPLPLEAYSKSNNKWSKKSNRPSKISTEYSTSFKEDVTLGNLEIIDGYSHNAQTTSSSFKKDLYANKTIKTLERQMDQGVSRANDNTKEERKLQHRFEVKSNVVKPTQIEATLDDTLWQDTLKMAETADNETKLFIDHVTDKGSKIKENDAVKGITPETRIKSGINMIPVDFKAKDKLKMVENAVNKTEFSTEDHKDKYVEDKIKNGKKSETEFNSGFESIPIDNLVMTGAAKKEKDFLIEQVVDKSSIHSENKIEKAKNFQPVTENKLKMAGTAVNKFEPIIENNYIKGNSTNHDIEDILSKGNMSETRFRSDSNMIHKDFKEITEKAEITGTANNITEYVIEQNKDEYIEDSIINIENGKKSDINMIPYDYNDKTDQTNPRTAYITTEFIAKENDLTNKENIVDKDYQIYYDDGQTSGIPEALKEIPQIDKDIKQQDINDVTFKAKHSDMKDQDGETLIKDSEMTMSMNDRKDQDFLNYHEDDDASKRTGTPTTNIALTSDSVKGTEATTIASAITVVLTAPTTPKLTVPESIPVFTLVVTSSKVPDVRKKVEFNATVNENKNKMADTQKRMSLPL